MGLRYTHDRRCAPQSWVMLQTCTSGILPAATLVADCRCMHVCLVMVLYAYLWHAVCWVFRYTHDRRCAPQSWVMNIPAPLGLSLGYAVWWRKVCRVVFLMRGHYLFGGVEWGGVLLGVVTWRGGLC